LLLYFQKKSSFSPSQVFLRNKVIQFNLERQLKLYFRKKSIVNIPILTVLASPIFPLDPTTVTSFPVRLL
jgi:hypothetical protein